MKIDFSDSPEENRLTIEQIEDYFEKFLFDKKFNFTKKCLTDKPFYYRDKVIYNTFTLPDNKWLVYFVEDISDIDFHSQEHNFDKCIGVLFIDINFKAKLFDNDIGEDEAFEEYPHRELSDGEIMINKCSKCGSTVFVNTIGSFACRKCGYYGGDGDFDSYLHDIFKRTNYKNQKERYYDYINSDEWKAKRLEVLALKGYKCAICGNTEHLQIHHMSYADVYEEENSDFSNLIVLCENCHENLHKFLKNNQDEIYDLKASLINLRADVGKEYKEKIEKTFCEEFRKLLPQTNKKHAMLIPYIKTILGINPINMDISVYLSAQNFYCRLKREGEI